MALYVERRGDVREDNRVVHHTPNASSLSVSFDVPFDLSLEAIHETIYETTHSKGWKYRYSCRLCPKSSFKTLSNVLSPIPSRLSLPYRWSLSRSGPPLGTGLTLLVQVTRHKDTNEYLHSRQMLFNAYCCHFNLLSLLCMHIALAT